MVNMLWVLQVLHIFWYGLFIQMGLHFLKKGETQDLQNRIKPQDQQQQQQQANNKTKSN